MIVQDPEAALSDATARLERVRDRLTSTQQGIAQEEAELVTLGDERRQQIALAVDGHAVKAELDRIKRRRGAVTERLAELREMVPILEDQLRIAERDEGRARDALTHAEGLAILARARELSIKANALGAEYSALLTETWRLSVQARQKLGLQDGRTMWENRFALSLSPNMFDGRRMTVTFPEIVIG